MGVTTHKKPTKTHRQAIIHRACHRKTRHSEGVKFARRGRLPGTGASSRNQSRTRAFSSFPPSSPGCAVFYCPQKFPYGFNRHGCANQTHVPSNRTVCRAKRPSNFKRFYGQAAASRFFSEIGSSATVSLFRLFVIFLS